MMGWAFTYNEGQAANENFPTTGMEDPEASNWKLWVGILVNLTEIKQVSPKKPWKSQRNLHLNSRNVSNSFIRNLREGDKWVVLDLDVNL